MGVFFGHCGDSSRCSWLTSTRSGAVKRVSRTAGSAPLRRRRGGDRPQRSTRSRTGPWRDSLRRSSACRFVESAANGANGANGAYDRNQLFSGCRIEIARRFGRVGGIERKREKRAVAHRAVPGTGSLTVKLSEKRNKRVPLPDIRTRARGCSTCWWAWCRGRPQRGIYNPPLLRFQHLNKLHNSTTGTEQ